MDLLTKALILTLIHESVSLIAYDCTGNKNNITTLSLLKANECKPQVQDVKNVQEEKVYLQLLQRTKSTKIKINQCKIVINRHVTYCGRYSHASEVKGGHASYVKTLGRQACLNIFRSRSYRASDWTSFSDLPINRTYTRPLQLNGYIDSGGKCNGDLYGDSFGSWSYVIVQGTISITLKEHFVDLDLDSSEVLLDSHQRCDYLKKECMDNENGETFWDLDEPSTCDKKKFVVLYEGFAKKLQSNSSETIFVVESNEITFALTIKSTTWICDVESYQTEHPKLVIMQGDLNKFPITKILSDSGQTDMFSYVNSKLLYVERHSVQNVKSLYKTIEEQKCELKKQIYHNMLSLAIIAPEVFAYNYMQQPGFTASVAGEVVHIIECVPIEVTRRHTVQCFYELPVLTHDNKTRYMMPRNRILKDSAIQIDCNRFPLPYYESIMDNRHHLHSNGSSDNIISPTDNDSEVSSYAGLYYIKLFAIIITIIVFLSYMTIQIICVVKKKTSYDLVPANIKYTIDV